MKESALQCFGKTVAYGFIENNTITFTRFLDKDFEEDLKNCRLGTFQNVRTDGSSIIAEMNPCWSNVVADYNTDFYGFDDYGVNGYEL